jgi:hypothetical protein
LPKNTGFDTNLLARLLHCRAVGKAADPSRCFLNIANIASQKPSPFAGSTEEASTYASKLGKENHCAREVVVLKDNRFLLLADQFGGDV